VNIEIGAIKVHADDQADTGEWTEWTNENLEPYTVNGKRIEFKLRRPSRGLTRRLAKKRHRRVWDPQLKIHQFADADPDGQDALFDDIVDQAWLDTRNLAVEVADDGAAELASKTIGRRVKVGETVGFDGHLTREAKEFLIDKIPEIGAFIVRWNNRLEAAVAKHDEALASNLSTGSSSS